MNYISKEKINFLLSKLIDAISSILIIKLITNLAAKDEVSKYMLAASIVALFNTIFLYPLNQGFLRYYKSFTEFKEQERVYFSHLNIYFVLFFTLIILSFISLFLNFSFFLIFVLVAFWIFFDASKNLLNAFSNIQLRRDLLLHSSLIDFLFKIFIFLFVYLYFDMNVNLMVFSLILSLFLCSFYLLYNNKFKWSQGLYTFDTRVGLETLKICWPMMVWGGFPWLTNMSSRWILSEFDKMESVAEFGVLLSIVTFPISFLVSLFNGYFQPVVYSMTYSKKVMIDFVFKKIIQCIPIFFLVFIIYFFFSDEIVNLLASESYAENSEWLPAGIAFYSFYAICSLFSLPVFAYKMANLLIMANILPGIISLLIALCLIPYFGVGGAFIAFCASNVIGGLLFLIAFWNFKKG